MNEVEGKKIENAFDLIYLNRIFNLSRKSKTRHPLLEIFKVKYSPKINRV
jgi:hypothetical protein